MKEVEIIHEPGGAGDATPPHAKEETIPGYPTSGVEYRQAGFPLAALGGTLQAMGLAICATERTPEAMAGCVLLGILSSAIGRGLQVQSGPNRLTRGNLFILAAAQSGSGKSETFRHAAKPFLNFEGELLKMWTSTERPGLQAEKELLEIDLGNLKGKAKGGKGNRDDLKRQLETTKASLQGVEDRLHAPALSAEDITVERLAVLLAYNDEQIASLSSDAGAIVNNLLGRYSKDRTDEALYLKAYSGDAHRVDRQCREPVALQSPCLAALWLTQPDKLQDLLASRSLSEGGFIPRMLVCDTQCEPCEIGAGTPAIPEPAKAAYWELIQALLQTYRLSDSPAIVAPSPDALALLNEHHNGIVRRRIPGGDLRDITSFAARWNENAWRIAVCLHAAKHGTGAASESLALETAERAIKIVDWFSAQQLEILSAGRQKARRDIQDEVFNLLADQPKGITARDVLRARIKPDAESCRALLAEMEAASRITGTDRTPERGGHPVRVFTLARQ